jgi:hypothetical protein
MWRAMKPTSATWWWAICRGAALWFATSDLAQERISAPSTLSCLLPRASITPPSWARSLVAEADSQQRSTVISQWSVGICQRKLIVSQKAGESLAGILAGLLLSTIRHR